MSSTVPTRPSGMAAAVASRFEGSAFHLSCIGDSLGPGKMTLERMLSCANWIANDLEKATTPALAAW